MKAVIVTGSSGLIGSAVVRRFAQDFRVFAFDREGPPHPPPVAEIVSVDLASDESVRRALAHVRASHGDQLEAVIHLAAYYDFSGEPSPKYEEVTVRGTERLLRGLRDVKTGQFLFSSTMLVHAPCQPGQKINEDWPLEPKWEYPKSKVRTEQLIRAQHGVVPAVILRIAGVYDDICHSIPISHQIQRIYERRLTSRVFPGDPTHGQAFVHLDDVVESIWRAVERRSELPPELVLLIGESETLSYEEIQRTAGRLIHGEDWPTYSIPKALAKAGAMLLEMIPGEEDFIKPWMIDLADDHYELDISRASRHLNWNPHKALRDTLPKMIAALQADPLGWYREHKLPAPPWLTKSATAEVSGRS